MGKKEEQAWFELGAFVQFCNDTQDFYKDAVRGIRSFATTRDDDTLIRADLEKQWQQIISVIAALKFPDRKKSKATFTLYAMYVVILAKLDFFVKKCDGHFSANRLTQVGTKKASMPLLSWHSLAYTIPKITNFRFRNYNH